MINKTTISHLENLIATWTIEIKVELKGLYPNWIKITELTKSANETQQIIDYLNEYGGTLSEALEMVTTEK